MRIDEFIRDVERAIDIKKPKNYIKWDSVNSILWIYIDGMLVYQFAVVIEFKLTFCMWKNDLFPVGEVNGWVDVLEAFDVKYKC